MKSVKARWFHKGRQGKIRVIVCHDMEAPEQATTAEAVARYFATTDRPASAHVNVDSDSAVRCVADADTAFAAPGCNHDGLHVEIAGYARQSKAEWLDPYSRAALGRAAKIVAAWCKTYKIPVKHLTVAELQAGKRGIVGHVDVSNAYHRTDHGDPGKNFPWGELLKLVLAELEGKPAPVEKPRPVPMPEGVPSFVRELRLLAPPMKGDDIRDWQARMAKRGKDLAVDGVYGPESRGVCRAFQRGAGLPDTGIVDAATWKATWLWEPPAEPA